MSGNGEPPARRNPFSPMAVARITDFDSHDSPEISIETDAIRQATSHVTAYLRSSAEEDHAGTVIAIVGDYGTGKTHLAVQLVRYARAELTDPANAMYLDATAESFIELYRRFMHKVGLAGVLAQVSDYYADVVAESLQSTGLTADTVEWLNSRDLQPEQVVERMGLMESALLRKVQGALRDVTENRDFGTALALLLRKGFEHSVWAWLTGGHPDQVLVERGITKPIDSEVAALEAMGVFALLFGGRRRRFVLVVDELDKIFSLDNQPQPSTLAAFQTLLEVFAKAGACLVLSGLPDFRTVLGPSVRQRIAHTVTMAGLGKEEVAEFVQLAQGGPTLDPFTLDSIGYLNTVARGNPRNVIRLCHRVFRIVTDQGPGTLVTQEVVEQAARELFGTLSSDDIHGVVRRLLDAAGYDYHHDFLLGVGEESKADFWISFPGREGGCAVLITQSLLDSGNVAEVRRRVGAVKDAAEGAEIVVVVNGVLVEGAAIQVRELIGRDPLVHVERTFAEDFRALVGAIGQLLVGPAGGEPLMVLGQRIDLMARQNSSLYGFMEQLAEHFDSARGSTERQLAAIQRRLTALPEADGAESAPRSPLPPDVERLFREAVDVLEELTQLDVMLAEAFEPAPEEDQEAVHRRLRSVDFREAAGRAVLMQKTVLRFRTSVAQWFSTEAVGGAVPTAEAEDRLDQLCRAYDGISEYLPVFGLDPLFELPPWSARNAGMVAAVNQAGRRNRVATALENLSPRVKRAVWRSSPSGGR
jgi:Cdc6-like AAA superfamily ATPase